MASDVDPMFEFEAPRFVDFTKLEEVDSELDTWFDDILHASFFLVSFLSHLFSHFLSLLLIPLIPLILVLSSFPPF